MQCERVTFLLIAFLLSGGTLALDYDMAQIGTCVQIYFDGISLVAKQLPNLVSDLKKCVNFQTIADLEKMNLGLFTLEAFSWVQSLANSMDCLWKMTDRLEIYLNPYFGRLRTYGCHYIGVPKNCIPKLN